MPDATIPLDENPIVATRPVNLPATGDMLANPALFEHMQRVAKMFMKSSLIPEHLKKNDGADAFLALQIARERGESPVAVMQNIYFVSGKAGWLTAYMIGRANRSGVFKGRIKWRTVGKGEEMEVTAFAIAADDGTECSATVSMAMAIGEGWARNAKYKTMQEHMLKWRSATMLIRLYCPEVMHGMMSADELEDMEAARGARDVTDHGSATTAPPPPRRADFQQAPAAAQDVQTENDTADQAEPEGWPLHDETGETVGRFTAVEWARKFTDAFDKLHGPECAQLLENNRDTAKAIWEDDSTDEQTAKSISASYAPLDEAETVKNWKSDALGEGPKMADIKKMIGESAGTVEEVDDIMSQNAAFLAKLSAFKRDDINKAAAARKLALANLPA